MGFINIYYNILQKGNTEEIINDRIQNPTMFDDWDNESLSEEIKKNKYYYKVKFIKYPKIGIDVDKLMEWAEENKYKELATEDEKISINWDGTRENLLLKKCRIVFKRRLIKWAESKQVIDSKTGFLTDESPIIPNKYIFYKVIDYGSDRYEWIFQNELYNTEIYNYMLLK